MHIDRYRYRYRYRWTLIIQQGKTCSKSTIKTLTMSEFYC